MSKRKKGGNHLGVVKQGNLPGRGQRIGCSNGKLGDGSTGARGQ